MDEKRANEIMYKLLEGNEGNCFTPDGRLGIFPQWLKHSDIDELCEIGLFRREPGNLENYMHTSYYLNPCCEKPWLSNGCTYPNCVLFHFNKQKEDKHVTN